MNAPAHAMYNAKLRSSRPEMASLPLATPSIAALDSRLNGPYKSWKKRFSDDPGVCRTAVPPRNLASSMQGLRYSADRRSGAVLLPDLLAHNSTDQRACLPLLWAAISVFRDSSIQSGSRLWLLPRATSRVYARLVALPIQSTASGRHPSV